MNLLDSKKLPKINISKKMLKRLKKRVSESRMLKVVFLNYSNILEILEVPSLETLTTWGIEYCLEFELKELNIKYIH